MSELAMEVPATVEAVDLVHDALDGLWERQDDVSARDRIRVATAVVEIVGNIVEHAFRLDEQGCSSHDRRLSLELTVDDGTIEAVLSDNGLPTAIDLSEVSMPGDDAESGRGLALAMAALDDVVYDRVDNRNQWTLRCRRSTQ